MAHIAKYKAPSVGHMLAHYRRDRSSLERDNIDPERIKNDLVVGHYTNKAVKLVVGACGAARGRGTVESRIERVNKAQKAAGKRATPRTTWWSATTRTRPSSSLWARGAARGRGTVESRIERVNKAQKAAGKRATPRTTWWSATTRTRPSSSLWGAWSRARARHGGESHRAREQSPEGRREARHAKNDLVVGHYTNKAVKLVVGAEPREGEARWRVASSA